MKIISQRKRIDATYYSHNFDYKNNPGSGYCFECTKEGEVLNMNPIARENYTKCLNGTYDVKDLGIVKYEKSYTEPAIGECNTCGEEVCLQGFTNTCHKCGTDYNMSGQQLASRSQWGEETGESLQDILSADSDYDSESDTYDYND